MILVEGENGVAEDRTRVVQLFERVIKEGSHVSSMQILANLLASGWGVIPKDIGRAVNL